MATIRLWMNMDECRDVQALYQVAKALREAARAAADDGCAVSLGNMEVGDREVEVSGSPAAIVAAAREFSERGFEPTVCAANEAEFEALDEILADGTEMELEEL